MSLGAFMAGVLLSESEYRHELQADIEPFEGLLLGFFFISVGMSADLPGARAPGARRPRGRRACSWPRQRSPSFLARIQRGNVQNALRFGLALPQASEFGFVLFAAAVAAGALGAVGERRSPRWSPPPRWSLTPILFAGSEGCSSRA